MTPALLLTLLLTQTPSPEATRTAALEAVTDCLHWGGEEPYSPERAKQIRQGAKVSCAKAATALKEARKRLPDDEAVAWALLEYLGNQTEHSRCSLVPKSGLADVCAKAKRYVDRASPEGSGVFDTFCFEYACQAGRCAPLFTDVERECRAKP